MQELTFSMTFSSAVSVTTGMGVAGLVDNAVYRDNQSVPVIPSRTIKGVWRVSLERLIRSGQIPGLSVHGKGQPSCKHQDSACALCEIFGSAAIPSAVFVGVARPSDYQQLASFQQHPSALDLHSGTQVRTRTAVSRRRQTALPDHLFSTEVFSFSLFSGSVRLSRPLSSDLLQILKVSGQLVQSVGSNRSVGNGKLESGIRLELIGG